MGGFEVVRQVFGFFSWLFSSLIAVVVGPITWRPPRWAGWLGERGRHAVAEARRRPRRAIVLGLASLLALGGVGAGVRWWQHRPRPIEIAVTVTPPPPTPIEERAKALPAVIGFSSSVAPLSALGKPVTSGVELSPKIEGSWRWRSDHELAFEPKGDWPVGQRFNVRLAKRGLVAEPIRLDSYSVEFDSARFSVEVREKEFYQDPVDPTLKKVVLTYSFSHPVDAATFEKGLQLTLVPGTKQDKEVRYKAQVSYDKLRGKAFVHSAPIEVPQHDATMRAVLEKGVRAKAGGPATSEEIAAEVTVPGLYNFLKVQSVVAQVVDNARNEPEQVLVIETSAGVSEAEMKRNVEAWVLPVYDPADPDEEKQKRRHDWTDPERVDAELLKRGHKLALEPIAQEQEYATLHSFRYKAEVGRYVYVHVKKGLRAFGGYLLGEPQLATAQVPPFPRQLRILHSGSLLSLSGEKKVSLFARDVPGVRVEIARVLPDQLQHVVTQGRGGDFAHPSFSYQFDMDNASERFVEDKRFAAPGSGKPIYEAIDLGGYLGGGEGRRGVFFLRVHAWDPQQNRLLGEQDERLVVLTDLGILVKETEDGGREVFVASIHAGDPVAGARVQVLGKNGQPVATVTTDGEGHAHIDSLNGFVREKQPVMILASKGRDSAYLPLNGHDRYLDLSRFDIGGVSSGERPRALSAYVFSDRGLYRPGEEIRAGVIVRANDWRTALEGVPIELTIADSRGLTIKKQRTKLPASGLVELRHATTDIAPTGTYTIGAYLVKEDRPDQMLGSTTVRVREFLPDKMKIAVHLSSERPAGEGGWVRPEGLSGNVTLTNLFGTPAAGRKVRAQLTLSPALPSFPKLRDFHFFDPMLAKESASEPLNEVETDEHGEAHFDLQLQRWKPATYRLTLTAEGFEEGGGRGVTGEAQVVVSPMPFLVGYKADGDLGYLSKSSDHKVELVAVGPSGEREAHKDLRAVLFERRFVSVLTKQPNGTFKYESVRREIELSQKPLSIAKDGTRYALPTDKPGDFTLVVRGEKEIDLQKIEFTVAGAANLTRSMEKNAELGLQLKSRDVEPGQEIELSIKAPYTGTGLITIERDRVYAYKWFKSSTTASVQTIKLPDALEGGGYVAVSFLRDAGSEEVFASPLSYSVQPFSVSRQKRQVKLSVDVPELARPGEPLAMKVKADRPTKAVVFAVDEGILRVADYATPDPLGFFFQKRALGVRTAQILDLVLPEFSRLMAAVAPGGDSEGAIGANLNPFKRKHAPPVAYWSGIVDVGPSGKTLTYEVPDSFNGQLRVMAVAVEPEALGAIDRRLIVRGDYVLSPSAPLAVAPGDEFELTTSVANNVEKGSDKVEVHLEVTPGLEIVGAKQATLTIQSMHEGKAAFKLRATEHLGAATATLIASGAGKPAKLRTELSVRPAVPYTVTFQAGHLKDGDKTVPVPRQLYAEFRGLRAGLSRLPLGLSHGLTAYLEKFPHGCTEQVASQAVPAIVLGKHPEFGFTAATAEQSFRRWLDIVRARQNDEGAFGLWAASPKAAPLPSVWTLLVLTEAKERGLSVPQEILKAGQGYLQGLAARDGNDLSDERLRAMAIYTLTRQGQVTTSYASALRKRLEADFAKEWKQDLAAAYLAGTLALLKQTDKARSLIDGVQLSAPISTDWTMLLDPLARDAQVLYLLARHFPERASAVTQVQLDKLVEPIFKGSYNTFSSAFTILALETYGRVAKGEDGKGGLAVSEVLPSGTKALSLPDSLLPVASYSPEASALKFSAEGAFGAYWLVEQRGFDRKVPDKAIAQKVEVFREYTDTAGKPIDKISVGDEVQVHVRVRALGKETIPNLALVDLLPGGFEVVLQEKQARSEGGEEQAVRGHGEEGEGGPADEAGEGDDSAGDAVPEGEGSVDGYSLPIAAAGSTMSLEFGDVREDRVVLYTSAEPEVRELVYVLKATNVGSYRVAPVLADSLYDRSVLARSTGGKITVYRK